MKCFDYIKNNLIFMFCLSFDYLHLWKTGTPKIAKERLGCIAWNEAEP
jgi:hypothetical protein